MSFYIVSAPQAQRNCAAGPGELGAAGAGKLSAPQAPEKRSLPQVPENPGAAGAGKTFGVAGAGNFG